MKRFQRLISLTEYIEGFTLPELGIRPIVTTAQADATSKLQHLSGVQVLAARPECRQQGDTDSYSSVISPAFFVVAKGLGAATPPPAPADFCPECRSRPSRLSPKPPFSAAGSATASSSHSISRLCQ